MSRAELASKQGLRTGTPVVWDGAASEFNFVPRCWDREFINGDIKAVSFGPEIEFNFLARWSELRTALSETSLLELPREHIRQPYFARRHTDDIHAEFVERLEEECPKITDLIREQTFNVARLRESHSQTRAPQYFVELKSHRSPENQHVRQELCIETSMPLHNRLSVRASDRIAYKTRLHEGGTLKTSEGDLFTVEAHIDLPLDEKQWLAVRRSGKLPSKLANDCDFVFIDVELPSFIPKIDFKHITLALRCLESAVPVPMEREDVKELLGWRNLARTGVTSDVEELCKKIIRKGRREAA